MGAEILPGNASGWERAVADALDPSARLGQAIDAIAGTKIVSPPSSWLPFLVYEYGLGELTPYIPNLYDLIREGIYWQRDRGTPAAISRALGWLGYTATIEEANPLRRYWNLFQLEIDRVRDAFADLDRIDGVANLSAPERSVFWRGWHGYDVRPLTYSARSWSESHFGAYSGVRVRDGGAIWSFGRTYEADHTMTEAELTALGVWTDPPATTDLGWDDIAWDGTDASWQSDALVTWGRTTAAGLFDRPMWIEFRDAGDAVIGYRRARAVRYVTETVGGVYKVGQSSLAPSSERQPLIYVEALTGFGDGHGSKAGSFGVVFDCVPLDGETPGLMWARADQLTVPSDPVAVTACDIAFGQTIRERVKALLRF